MESAIIITQASTARKLIQLGEEVIDIKPHRKIPNASVFIFKPSETIKEVLEKENMRYE